MPEVLPLTESDLARLQRKKEQARKTTISFLSGAFFLPLFIGFLLFITPLEFEATALYLAGGLVVLFSSPFLLLLIDSRRKYLRLKHWITHGYKYQIKGAVTEKNGLVITVESKKITVWENRAILTLGTELTIEYVSMQDNPESITDVLRINGEPNPHFESVIRVDTPRT